MIVSFVIGFITALAAVAILASYYLLSPLDTSKHTFTPRVHVERPFSTSTGEQESCRWLNAIIKQVCMKIRSDSQFTVALVQYIDRTLRDRKASIPGFIGPITITGLELGESYPIIKSVTLLDCTESRTSFDIEFEYADSVKVSAMLAFMVNLLPTQINASLPIELSISDPRLSGHLIVDYNAVALECKLSLLDCVVVDVEVASVIGAKRKIVDLAKVSRLVKSALYRFLKDTLVHPNALTIPVNKP